MAVSDLPAARRATVTRFFTAPTPSRARRGMIGRLARGLAGGLLPDRDMLAAVAGEGLPRPPVPPLAQTQPCELGHQVELGRPHIPERHRGVLATAVHDLDVVPAHRLR